MRMFFLPIALMSAGLLGLNVGQGPAQTELKNATQEKCATASAGQAGDHAGESAACQTSTNRCAEYGACSLYGDLAGARGETLKMYAAEKAQDGKRYENFALPTFEAVDLAGNKVHSADLGTQPTLLVLLAGHCGHSIATLKILKDAQARFAESGVRVLGVFLNSGTPDQVQTLTDLYQVDYDVWVYPDDTLGDLVDAHLVPTYLFVQERKVKQKLVGMKTLDALDNFITAFSE